MSDTTWEELVVHARNLPRRQWANTGEGEEAVPNPAHAGKPQPGVVLLKGGGFGFAAGALAGAALVNLMGFSSTIGALIVAAGLLAGLAVSYPRWRSVTSDLQQWQSAQAPNSDPHSLLGKVWPHDLGKDGTAILGLLDRTMKEVQAARRQDQVVVSALKSLRPHLRWRVAVNLFSIAQVSTAGIGEALKSKDQLVRIFDLLEEVRSGSQDQDGLLGVCDRIKALSATSDKVAART